MVFVYSITPSKPKSNIACGVLATGNSFAVALFTPTSVACADSKTAIKSSKSELK